MNKRAEQIVREMEKTGVMMERKMYKEELLEGLLDYQDIVNKYIFADQEGKYRLCDAKEFMQNLAKEKGYEEHEVISNVVKDMDKIEVEIKKNNGRKAWGREHRKRNEICT